MSILSIVPLIRAYNQNKPPDTSKFYDTTKEDVEKVQEICRAIIALNPPYDVEVILYERSKAMYLKCTERAQVHLPKIKEGATKV